MAGTEKHRIQITVPDYYKQVDEGVWEELEKYLYAGFLTSASIVLDKTFVFKTLNSYEVRSLDYFRPLRKSPTEINSNFRSAFIAHSIAYIDGENLLRDRSRHIRKLIAVIAKISAGLQEEILDNLKALNSRSHRLYPLTEVYAHENRSRFKWLQFKDTPIHSPLATGIPGTDELGMNYCQQIWVALNRLTDNREQLEHDWGNAKFIGGCFAGKGIRAIEERDKARRETEKQDIQDLKMRVLYAYLNRKADSEFSPEVNKVIPLPDGRLATVEKMHRADSVEQLADQLSAALSGEKDFHDKVIEDQQKKLQIRARAIEIQRMQLWQQPSVLTEAAQSSSVPLSGGSRILGGPAAAEAQLARMKQLQLDRIHNFRNADLNITNTVKAPDSNNKNSDEK